VSPPPKRAIAGIAVAAVVILIAAAAWWFFRAGRVGDRLELIGPGTRAFVTFLATPEDRPLRELLQSLQRRTAAGPGDRQPEWIRSVGDSLSGAAIDHVRATGMVEAGADGRTQVVLVVSLGRMARVVAKMWFGMAASEREVEVYRKARILLGRDRQDLAMAFVGNNLILSRDPAGIRSLIDRIGEPNRSASPSAPMKAVLKDVDPRAEMPGYGALVNDPDSLAALWQLATGAPEGSEIELPGSFEGMGFRFGFSSLDSIKGDGYVYFADDAAAEGAVPLIQDAIPRLFSHFGLKASAVIEPEGRRLRIDVLATGLQAALDRHFPRDAK
jgi:hypothetical protein